MSIKSLQLLKMDNRNEGKTFQVEGGENCLFPSPSSSCRLVNIGRETGVSSDEEVKGRGTNEEETPREFLSSGSLEPPKCRRSSSCSPYDQTSSLSRSASPPEDISFEGGSLGKKDACQRGDTGPDRRLGMHDVSVLPSPSPWISSSLVGGGGEDLKSSVSRSMSPHALSLYLASFERTSSRKALQESIHRRCDEVERFLRHIRSASPSSLCSSPPCPSEGGAVSEADVGRIPVEAVRADQEPLVSSRLPLLSHAKSEKESAKEIEGASSLCEPERNSIASTDREGGSNTSRGRCDGRFDDAMKYESPSSSVPCSHSSSSECGFPSRRLVSPRVKEERQHRPLSTRKRVSQGSDSYGRACSVSSEMNGNRHPLSSSPSLHTLGNKVHSSKNESRRIRREDSHMNARPVAKTRFGSSTNSRSRCGGETSRSVVVDSSCSSASTRRHSPSEFSSSPSSVLTGSSSHTILSPNHGLSSTSSLSNGLPSSSACSSYNGNSLAATGSPSSFPRLQSSDCAPKSVVKGHDGDDNGMNCEVLRGRSPPPSRPLPFQTAAIKTRSQYSSKKNLERTRSKGCSGGQGRSDMARKSNTSVLAKGNGEDSRRGLTGSSASARPVSVKRSLLHSSSSSSTLLGEKSIHLVAVTKQEREQNVAPLGGVSHHTGDGGRSLTVSQKGRRSLSVSAGEKSATVGVRPTTAVARSVSTSFDDPPGHSGVVSRPMSLSSASSSSLLLHSSSSSLANGEGCLSSRDLRPKSFLSPRVMSRPRTARRHQPVISTTHNRAHQQRKCSPQAPRNLARSPSSPSMQSSTRKRSPRAMTARRPEVTMMTMSKTVRTGSRLSESKLNGRGRRNNESAEVPSSPERSQQTHHEKQSRPSEASLQKSTSRSVLSSTACSSPSSSFQHPLGKNSLSSSPPISFSSASLLQREASASALSLSTSGRRGETPSKVMRGRRRPGESKGVSGVSSLSSSASVSNLQSHSNHKLKSNQLAGVHFNRHRPPRLRDNHITPPSTGDQSWTTATASLSTATPSKRRAFSSCSSSGTAPRRERRSTAVIMASSLSAVDGGVHDGKATIVSSSSSQQDTSPLHREVTRTEVQEENKDSRRSREEDRSHEVTTLLAGIRTYRSEEGRHADSEDRVRSSSVSRSYRHRTYSSSVPPQSPSQSCSPSSARFLYSSEKLDRMHKMKEQLSETSSSSPASSFVSRIRRDLLMNAFHQESSSLSKSPSDILTLFKIMSRVVNSSQDTPPSFTSPSSSFCDSSSPFASLKSSNSSGSPSTSPSETLVKTSVFSSCSSLFARDPDTSLDRPSPQSSFSSRTFLSGNACPSSLCSSDDENLPRSSSSSAGTHPSPPSEELNGSLTASDASSSPCSSSVSFWSSRREIPSHFSPSSSSEVAAGLQKDCSNVPCAPFLSLSRSSRFPPSKGFSSFLTETRREDPSPNSSSLASSVSPSISSSCCVSPSLTCSVLDPCKYREKSLYFSTVPICASSPPSSSKDFGTSSNSSSGSDSEESSCKVQPSGSEEGRRKEGSSSHSAAGEKQEEDREKENTTKSSGEGERREGSVSKPNEEKERKMGEGVKTSEGDSTSGVTQVKDPEEAPLLPSSTVDGEGRGKEDDEGVSASPSSSLAGSESLSHAGSSSLFSFLKSGVMLPRLRLGSLLENSEATAVPRLDESLHALSSSSSSVSISSSSSSSLGGGEICRKSPEEDLENRAATGTDERVSQGDTEKLSSPETVFQGESSIKCSIESDKNTASSSTEDGRTSVPASLSTESGGKELPAKSRGEESIPSPGHIERGDNDKEQALSSGSLLHVPTEESTRGRDDQSDSVVSESPSRLGVSVDEHKDVKGLERSRSPLSPSSSPRRSSPRNHSGISHVSSTVRTKATVTKKTSPSPPGSRRPSSSIAAVSASDVKSAGVATRGGGGKEEKNIEESTDGESHTTSVTSSSSSAVAGKSHYVGKKSPTLHPTPKQATRTSGATHANQADGVSRKGLEKVLPAKKEVGGERKGIGNGIGKKDDGGAESTEKKNGVAAIPRVTISRSPSLGHEGLSSISGKAKSSLRRGSSSSVASSASQHSTQSVRGPGTLTGKGRTRASTVASTPSSPSSGGGATSPQTSQSPSFSVEGREVEGQGGVGGAGAGKAKSVTRRPLTGLMKKTTASTGGELHKKGPASPRGKFAGTAAATLSSSIQVSSGGSEGGVSTSSNASGSPRTPAATPSTTTSSVKPSALRDARKASKPPSVGQQQQQQPLSSSSSSGRLSRTRTRSFSPSPSFAPSSSSSPPASPALSSSSGRMTATGGGLTVKTAGGGGRCEKTSDSRITSALFSSYCFSTAFSAFNRSARFINSFSRRGKQ